MSRGRLVGLVLAFALGLAVPRRWGPVEPPRPASLRDRSPEVSSRSQLGDVLPPRWKLGDTWRVASLGTYGLGLPGVPGEPPGLAGVTTEFVVAKLPDARDPRFRVGARERDNGDEYALYFPETPLHLSYAEQTGAHRRSVLFNDVGPSLSYCENGGDCASLVLVFPFLPPGARERDQPLVREMSGRPTTEEIRRDPDGVWFLIKTKDRVATVRWRYGDPWWSSVDMVCGEAPEAMHLCGMARLLRE